MVNKKVKPPRKAVPVTILVEDRYKLQLLNAYVDRATLAVDNARLRMAVAQRELDVATAELNSFGREISGKYQFSMETDSVDWTTGEIKREG